MPKFRLLHGRTAQVGDDLVFQQAGTIVDVSDAAEADRLVAAGYVEAVDEMAAEATEKPAGKRSKAATE